MMHLNQLLNSITMYRLVLYGLILMTATSILFSFLDLITFGINGLVLSVLILTITCFSTNIFFSNVFKTPRNTESALITALILFFVLAPVSNQASVITLFLAGALAMGSKYILAISARHIFNPAAIAVVVLGMFKITSSAWWIASPVIAPLVIVIGLLIVRKLRRFSMFAAFVFAAFVAIAYSGYMTSGPFFNRLLELFVAWPLIYFGAFMLTEPLTTPPTRNKQIVYGCLVGALFGMQYDFGIIHSTPELALVIGNIFSYLVSSKQILKLKLREKMKINGDIYNFSFISDRTFKFKPGQYLEWTLPHRHTDSRGNRRYFTIASSPTEGEVKLGVKISPSNSSQFKKNLIKLESGDKIFASHLAGDFTLPNDKNKKLVFIAGGIGITPYRSIIKYLCDQKERRDIILFYAASSPNSFVYKDILEEGRKIGVNIHYLTKRLTENTIRLVVDDYQERIFYVSGPDAMVTAYKRMLLKMGIKRVNIVTDYFPGY